MSNTALDPVEFDPFAAGVVTQVCPTTEAQREVWAADRLDDDSSLAYNEAVVLTLTGPLAVPRLHAALRAVIARHDALRATISPDGLEMLIGEGDDVAMQVHDLSELDLPDRDQRLADACRLAVESRFSLEHGPLFRVALYRLSATRHALLMTGHHIVCDGWSWGVIVSDLGRFYRAGQAEVPTPAASFVTYSSQLAADALDASSRATDDFWTSKLGHGSLPVLELPLDFRRPAVRQSHSRRVDHRVDAELVQGLRRLGTRNGCSLFSVLLGGFAALLHRLTGQDDLIVGIPAAGQMAADMPTLVGHCVNLLPIRLSVDGESAFDGLVRQTAEQVLDASEHQSMTYGSLLKRLAVRRDPSRSPLLGVTFNLDAPAANGDSVFDGLHVELRSVPRQHDNFELFLNAMPQSDGAIELELQYSTVLFEQATVTRWLESYEALLRAALDSSAQPLSRLAWLPASQLAAIAALQPAPVDFGPQWLVHGLVEAQCRATPHRIALRFGDDRLGYAELEAYANRLARLLRERRVGRGHRVGLCMARGIDMVVALVAVLKAGAAYVPMDPSVPQVRLDEQAKDAGLTLVLSNSAAASTPRGWSATDPTLLVSCADLGASDVDSSPLPSSPLDATPDDAAYVIYTSGSTGRPKGVCLAHRSVVNFLRSAAIEPGIAESDVITAVTTLSFDIALFELVLPLTVGAQVVVAPRDVAMDGGRLSALIESSGTTMLFATPGMWRMLQDADWNGAPGFRAMVGGESLPADLAAFLVSRTSELWNMYGPTETTVCSTLCKVDARSLHDDGIFIGHPVANTQVWVMDAAGEPCPIGVFGELWIGGAGVAIGYLERPALDHERFVAAPAVAGGGRVYRTGDRGRWCANGVLQHGGRIDAQIKVRGYRIEPGEIEACCNAMPSVTGSVATAWQAGPGDTRLVVYVAVAPDVPSNVFSPAKLQQALRLRLPEYMVPQHIVRLERIPRLPNGKVDRQGLPMPDPSADRPASRQRILPRNDTERVVLACMEQVLGMPGLGMDDDFFTLGGHSLLAARLVTHLNRHFELQLRIPTVFESPTAERLAAAVDAGLRVGLPKREPVVVQPGRRKARLSPMQERVRFVQEMHPERVLYNAPSAHRLRGPFDLDSFERTLREVIRRQSSLRTYFAFDADADAHLQVVADDIASPMALVDLSDIEASLREAVLTARIEAVVNEPIDIHRVPLFRAVLYRLAQDHHVFLFVPHHLIWDGWSFDLLQNEFADIYTAFSTGTQHHLPPLPVSYGDYAEWLLRWVGGTECQAQLRYWTERFASMPPTVAARTDRPRRAGMSGSGGIEWIDVDHVRYQPWRQLARRHDVTMNMVGFALYATLLASVIKTSSVVIAVPVRGRLSDEIEPVMGYFNNLLVVQVTVDAAQPLSAFLQLVKSQLLEVMHHQDVPFEMVAAQPGVSNRAQGVGLYNGLFSFQDVTDRKRRWGPLTYSPIQLFQKGATDDLGLWLLDDGEAMRGGFIYNADIYEATTARALHERFFELLNGACRATDPTLGDIMTDDGSVCATALQHLSHDAAAAANDVSTALPQDDVPSDSGTAPQWSDEERKLGEVWAGLLGIEVTELRLGDNFFDVGGDSFLAMRAVEQSVAALGFRADARRYVFETLAQLASRTTAVPIAATAEEPKSRLRRMLSAWRKSA